MRWTEVAVLGFLLGMTAMFLFLASRFRDRERAERAVRLLEDRTPAFGMAMGVLLGGLLVIVEADAIRLKAGLPPDDPLFRTIIMAGYLVETVGLAAACVVLGVGTVPERP